MMLHNPLEEEQEQDPSCRINKNTLRYFPRIARRRETTGKLSVESNLKMENQTTDLVHDGRKKYKIKTMTGYISLETPRPSPGQRSVGRSSGENAMMSPHSMMDTGGGIFTTS